MRKSRATCCARWARALWQQSYVTDAECARLDPRMPVEQASMNNPDPAEVSKAEVALKQSQKRFGELRC